MTMRVFDVNVKMTENPTLLTQEQQHIASNYMFEYVKKLVWKKQITKSHKHIIFVFINKFIQNGFAGIQLSYNDIRTLCAKKENSYMICSSSTVQRAIKELRKLELIEVKNLGYRVKNLYIPSGKIFPQWVIDLRERYELRLANSMRELKKTEQKSQTSKEK